ncbi:two-component system sensor histidine kinase NtrB [Thermodesulfovibrio hydrogeniphilus]
MKHEELFNEAILKITSASDALIKYYNVLENKIKLLTEEVEQKKRLLSSIIDSIDIAVVFFDSEGIIRLINKAGETLFNVKAEEIIGQKELPITIENDRVIPKDAPPFYSIVSSSEVFDSDGNRIGKVFICKDITRIRELEAENERNRRLSAMGSLVMKIAHEIRNPLGSIELYANMISEDLKDTLHGDYARRISNSVKMLRNTLENMLGFTRGIVPKKTEVCLNDFLSDFVKEFYEVFNRVGIEFKCKIQKKITVKLDPSLLRQALINLIMNAYQAMPDGGVLQINAKEENKFVKISVIDSGQGIDSEIIDKIFDPFFSTKDRGTGLGLSITNSIVSVHGGKIEVKSKPKEGTEFVLYFPVE